MGSIQEDIATSAAWIARALSDSGCLADFSPASLWEIDRFFDDHSRRGAARSGGLLSRDLGQRIFAIGSYIGEVARRSLGGEWIGDDADPQAEFSVALQLRDGTRCWPVQRAMKRFKNGDAERVAAWGLALGVPLGPRPAQSPLKKPFPLPLKVVFLIVGVTLALLLANALGYRDSQSATTVIVVVVVSLFIWLKGRAKRNRRA
jgi:hypothetical protein